MLSNESLGEATEAGVAAGPWISSVRPAYYNGQIVAVKSINKPYVALSLTIVMEINQV